MSISAADYAAGLVHDRRSAATAITRDCAPLRKATDTLADIRTGVSLQRDIHVSHSQRHVAGSSAAH